MLSNLVLAAFGALAVYVALTLQEGEGNKADIVHYDGPVKQKDATSNVAVVLVSFVVILGISCWVFPDGVPSLFSGEGDGNVDDIDIGTSKIMKMPTTHYEDILIRSIRENVAVGRPPF